MNKAIFLKLLALTLVIAMACILLCACDGNDTPKESESESESVQTPTSDVPTLVRDGEPQYAIIMPSKANAPIKSSINTFAKQLGALFNTTFSTFSHEMFAPEGSKMIYIGASQNEHMTSLLTGTSYCDTVIDVDADGNIYFGAWSPSAISFTTTQFLISIEDMIAKGDKDVTVTEALNRTSNDGSMLNAEIPTLNATEMPYIFSVRGESRNAYKAAYKSKNEQDWAAYCKMLEDAGFEKVQENRSADYAFAVYQKGEIMLTVDLFVKTEELIIIVDEGNDIVPLKPMSVEKKTEPKLISIGLEYTGALKGMCYILQASDRSFVIIDSGEGDAELLRRIYDYMKENIPEGEKPVIRAWFLSHAHGDHINGLNAFATSKYSSLVECHAVYSNNPIEKYQSAYENGEYSSRLSKIKASAKALGAEFVTAHTGQKYYFADIEISMLGTADDMLTSDFNDLDEVSLFFSADVNGKRLLFSGDSGAVYIGTYLLKRYTAATLKCDICQATSHGVNNTTANDYYKMAAPQLYLWPSDLSFYNRHTPNKYIQSDKNAEIHYSFEGTKVFTLT